MKKRIFAIIILVFILSFIFVSVSSNAYVIIDDTQIDDGYITITADNAVVNKFLYASNFYVFTSTESENPWEWKLTSQGSYNQTNANYWALLPFATSYINNSELGYMGYYFDDLPENVEITVTYKLQGLGALYLDDFIPIFIYDVTPGNITYNDIRNNVSGQTLLDNDKFKKRDTTYFYDSSTDTAIVSYTTNTNDYKYINDLVFVKHNASITYDNEHTFILIPEIKVKLNYTDAQKLILLQKSNNELVQNLIDNLNTAGEYLFSDDSYDEQSSIDNSAEQKIEDFEAELSKAVAPDIEMSIPDVEIPDFNDSDGFMDVLLSCPGYLTLLSLSTSLWVVKLLIFGKG